MTDSPRQSIPGLFRTIQPPRTDTAGTPVCAQCDELASGDLSAITLHPNSQLAVTYVFHDACMRELATAALQLAGDGGA